MSAEPTAVNQKLSKLDDLADVSCIPSLTQSSLCAKCSSLRLKRLLARIKPPRKFPGISDFHKKIADVGQYYRKQSDPACNLCHLLSATRITVDQPRKRQQDHEDADELHVLNRCNDNLWVDLIPGDELLRGQSFLYLAVVPSDFNRVRYWQELRNHGESNGFLAIRRRGTSQPQIYAPQILSPLFDLSLAHHWIQYCKRHHKVPCNPPKSKAIAGLHLIDCCSLAVVPAPDQAEYTALSYVWGKPTANMGSLESTARSVSVGVPLPSPVPAVIADAIDVTAGLGFHYLWVDRYCIDQDSHSKHQQISQMDFIYHNAELTIVAAAGNGPEYGLPGIGPRPRCGQLTSTVGDFDLIPTLAHPHKAIQSSTWSTRGWTYQEAALSRRSLVFTTDQVYFECKAMNCHESLASNLDKLHTEDKSMFKKNLRGGLFGRSGQEKYGCFDESRTRPTDNLVRFMGMVEQYTARDLTHDTDSLNAFTGIIRNFEAQTTIRQIMGVPFCSDGSEKRMDNTFIDGLGWIHKATGRNDHGYPKRRPEFPSWSWAGWAGQIKYDLNDRSSGETLKSELDSISVEPGDGLEVSLSSYVDEAKAVLQDTTSHSAIHVRALALPASAFTYDSSSATPRLQIFGFPARLALSTGPWDVSHFCQSIQTTDQRKCIYFGHTVSKIVVMVLKAQNDSWSRLGLIFLDGVMHWDFHPAWKAFKMKSEVRWDRFEIDRQGIGEEAKKFRII